MTAEKQKEILKKVKIRAGIPEAVTVYDERIADIITGAIIKMRTGGVPQSVIDEASPAVTIAIGHYVRFELDGDTGETQKAKWHHDMFKDMVFDLSLEQQGATMEGLV